MHELSIALSILDLAAEEAERHGGRVAAVHLRLGPLAGVVKDALVSAYDLAREGTPLARAATSLRFRTFCRTWTRRGSLMIRFPGRRPPARGR